MLVFRVDGQQKKIRPTMTSQVRLRLALNIEIGVEGETGQNILLPLAHIHIIGVGAVNCRLNNTVNRVKFCCPPDFSAVA